VKQLLKEEVMLQDTGDNKGKPAAVGKRGLIRGGLRPETISKQPVFAHREVGFLFSMKAHATGKGANHPSAGTGVSSM
jgi:hypothetical protein